MGLLYSYFSDLLGLSLEPKSLTFVQICLRGVIVLTATLVMVRISSKRSLAEKTAFDAVLIVVLASVLARGINGSASFFPTLGAGFVLVLLHRALSALACYSHRFGSLIKGQPAILVKDGEIQRLSMQRNHISQHDLEEDLRLRAQTDSLSKIRVARIERSGEISFIKQE